MRAEGTVREDEGVGRPQGDTGRLRGLPLARASYLSYLYLKSQ